MFNKSLISLLIVSFVSSLVIAPQVQASPLLSLPEPGKMVNLSLSYHPAIIKGMTVNKDNPFLFDFIVDPGQEGLSQQALKQEGEKQIRYFLAALTVPAKDLWVNLSPYEKNRVIDESLGQTDMGRDLLAQDYLLKQLTASLIYPEKALGKNFWDKVYAKTQEKFGPNASAATQIPVNTFNKVWIMADQAEVYEHNQTAYVSKSHLKVMLEEDYLATQKNAESSNKVKDISADVLREVVIPQLEQEVNEGKNFAPLRQIFNAIILAGWYKNNLKESLLNQAYSDKSTIKGIDLKDKTIKEQIFNRYLEAYKKGVFNFVKEDEKTKMPRKYFSGGVDFAQAVNPMVTRTANPAMSANLGHFMAFQTTVIEGVVDDQGLNVDPQTEAFNRLREQSRTLEGIKQKANDIQFLAQTDPGKITPRLLNTIINDMRAIKGGEVIKGFGEQEANDFIHAIEDIFNFQKAVLEGNNSEEARVKIQDLDGLVKQIRVKWPTNITSINRLDTPNSWLSTDPVPLVSNPEVKKPKPMSLGKEIARKAIKALRQDPAMGTAPQIRLIPIVYALAEERMLSPERFEIKDIEGILAEIYVEIFGLEAFLKSALENGSANTLEIAINNSKSYFDGNYIGRGQKIQRRDASSIDEIELLMVEAMMRNVEAAEIELGQRKVAEFNNAEEKVSSVMDPNAVELPADEFDKLFGKPANSDAAMGIVESLTKFLGKGSVKEKSRTVIYTEAKEILRVRLTQRINKISEVKELIDATKTLGEMSSRYLSKNDFELLNAVITKLKRLRNGQLKGYTQDNINQDLLNLKASFKSNSLKDQVEKRLSEPDSAPGSLTGADSSSTQGGMDVTHLHFDDRAMAAVAREQSLARDGSGNPIVFPELLPIETDPIGVTTEIIGVSEKSDSPISISVLEKNAISELIRLSATKQENAMRKILAQSVAPVEVEAIMEIIQLLVLLHKVPSLENIKLAKEHANIIHEVYVSSDITLLGKLHGLLSAYIDGYSHADGKIKRFDYVLRKSNLRFSNDERYQMRIFLAASLTQDPKMLRYREQMENVYSRSGVDTAALRTMIDMVYHITVKDRPLTTDEVDYGNRIMRQESKENGTLSDKMEEVLREVFPIRDVMVKSTYQESFVRVLDMRRDLKSRGIFEETYENLEDILAPPTLQSMGLSYNLKSLWGQLSEYNRYVDALIGLDPRMLNERERKMRVTLLKNAFRKMKSLSDYFNEHLVNDDLWLVQNLMNEKLWPQFHKLFITEQLGPYLDKITQATNARANYRRGKVVLNERAVPLRDESDIGFVDSEGLLHVVTQQPPLEDGLSSANSSVFDSLLDNVLPVANGGIDLMKVQDKTKIQKNGVGVQMQLDKVMIERVKREGINSLTPVIFNITPVANIWNLLGLTPPNSQADRLS
jgi:hypothetical protein